MIEKTSELDILYKEKEKIDNKIWNIEAEQKKKEYLPYVGNYYKYKNSYSSSKSEKDYFYLYVYVKSYDEKNQMLNTFEFQTDLNGEVTIDFNKQSYDHTCQMKITKKEFKREWNKVKGKIEKYEI